MLMTAHGLMMSDEVVLLSAPTSEIALPPSWWLSSLLGIGILGVSRADLKLGGARHPRNLNFFSLVAAGSKLCLKENQRL